QDGRHRRTRPRSFERHDASGAVSDQGRWAGEPTREIHDPGDALLEATGLPQLDQLALPTAMAQERGDRQPDAGRRPQLGTEDQGRAVSRALGADRGRLQHVMAPQRKKPSALSSRPRASFGTPKGPLSPETGLSLSRTYVPSVTKREAKEPSLLLLLGGLLLRRSLFLRLARRLPLNSHDGLLVASRRKPVC